MIERKYTIAVIDDEPDILELVGLHLHNSGFNVKKFLTANEFLKYIMKETPDAIILDLMLPDADGFEICRYLKDNDRFKEIPLIILTARDTESDVVLGFDLGADDYVKKPFSPRELVARVKSLLKKYAPKETNILTVGNRIKIDTKRYKVFLDNKEIKLTTTEFKILKLLAENKGWVFTRNQILEYLWKGDKFVIDRTIDVHITNIRKKLKDAGKFIKNVRGIGYKIEE